MEKGVKVLTQGTDNHLLVFDVTPFHLNGRQAESLLREALLTSNRNAIPLDANGPWYTSGIRMGTPATTTLGMGPLEMQEIAEIVYDLLQASRPVSKSRAEVPPAVLAQGRQRVQALLQKFPLYPELYLA
jgi:glycine hydroxymethyltransferase